MTAEELVQEIVDSHRLDKDGELLLAELQKLYSIQPPEQREPILRVFRGWLASDDSIRAHWAISLIKRIGLSSELSTLEELLQEIQNGESELPRYFEQFLVPAIEELKLLRGH